MSPTPLLFYLGLPLRAYAAGLLVYMLLAVLESRGPAGASAPPSGVRRWLDPFYRPLLDPIRAVVRPLRFGARSFDPAPLLVLIGIKELHDVLVFLVAGAV